MNKPSERIVVFVTPAQKRAISAAAQRLGLSVSELMRQAVLSFGATSEQVKAASLVDRLRAPREPDALNAALGRLARGNPLAGDAPEPLPGEAPQRPQATGRAPARRGGAAAPLVADAHTSPLPADVLDALARTPEQETAAARAAAVARVTSARAQALTPPASHAAQERAADGAQRAATGPRGNSANDTGSPDAPPSPALHASAGAPAPQASPAPAPSPDAAMPARRARRRARDEAGGAAAGDDPLPGEGRLA
jgi:hypothetical protein